MVGPALLGPRGEVDEQPLGSPDVARHDHVHDAKAPLSCGWARSQRSLQNRVNYRSASMPVKGL